MPVKDEQTGGDGGFLLTIVETLYVIAFPLKKSSVVLVLVALLKWTCLTDSMDV